MSNHCLLNSINIPHMLLYFHLLSKPLSERSRESFAAVVQPEIPRDCIQWRFSHHNANASDVKLIKVFHEWIFIYLRPFHFITDIKLRYCDVSPAGSCCNTALEQKMAFHSRQAMDKNTRDLISKMSSTLQTRAQKFNGECLFTTLTKKLCNQRDFENYIE